MDSMSRWSRQWPCKPQPLRHRSTPACWGHGWEPEMLAWSPRQDRKILSFYSNSLGLCLNASKLKTHFFHNSHAMLLRDKGQSFHHQRWQPHSFALNTGTTRCIVLLTASHAQRTIITWRCHVPTENVAEIDESIYSNIVFECFLLAGWHQDSKKEKKFIWINTYRSSFDSTSFPTLDPNTQRT